MPRLRADAAVVAGRRGRPRCPGFCRRPCRARGPRRPRGGGKGRERVASIERGEVLELGPASASQSVGSGEVGGLSSAVRRSGGAVGHSGGRRAGSWRPYRVECTGLCLISEVKRHRARSLLERGNAREDFRERPARYTAVFKSYVAHQCSHPEASRGCDPFAMFLVPPFPPWTFSGEKTIQLVRTTMLDSCT